MSPEEACKLSVAICEQIKACWYVSMHLLDQSCPTSCPVTQDWVTVCQKMPIQPPQSTGQATAAGHGFRILPQVPQLHSHARRPQGL